MMCASRLYLTKATGTWIPLELGQQLAEKNGVYQKLKAIFEYIPGDVTPPPAPKHTTAASNKPKVPRAPPVRKPASMSILCSLSDIIGFTNQQKSYQFQRRSDSTTTTTITSALN